MSTLVTIPFENDQAAQARALLGAASEAGYDSTEVRTGLRGFRVPEEVYEEYVTTLAGGVAEDPKGEVDGDSTDDADADGDSTDEAKVEEAPVEKAEATKASAKKTPAKKTAAKKTTTSKSSLDDVLS